MLESGECLRRQHPEATHGLPQHTDKSIETRRLVPRYHQSENAAKAQTATPGPPIAETLRP